MVRLRLGLTEYEWTSTYNQLVTCAGILGLTGGAAAATFPIGRKGVMAGFCAMGYAGIAMSLVANFWSIIIGRILHGVSTGVFLSAGPRFMDITEPLHSDEGKPSTTRTPSIETKRAGGTGSSYSFK